MKSRADRRRVRQGMILCLFLLVATLLSGCLATGKTGKLTINGIVFQNRTDQDVQNVRVFVEKTSGFVLCSHVYPNSECSNMFPATPYRGNAIKVSWEQAGRSWSTADFFASAPETVIKGQPAKAYIAITGPGMASAELIQ